MNIYSYAGETLRTEYDGDLAIKPTIEDSACESCGSPAVYKLVSESGHFTCTCHACLRESIRNPMNVDELL